MRQGRLRRLPVGPRLLQPRQRGHQRGEHPRAVARHLHRLEVRDADRERLGDVARSRGAHGEANLGAFARLDLALERGNLAYTLSTGSRVTRRVTEKRYDG